MNSVQLGRGNQAIKISKESITTISAIPEGVLRWARCAFLHDYVPIIDSETLKIRHICVQCTKEKMKVEKEID